MPGGAANVASGVQTIDALLGNFRWNGLNITYSFPAASSYFAADYWTAGSAPTSPVFEFSSFAPASASLQTALSQAITAQLMAVAPLSYTQVAAGTASDSAFGLVSPVADAELGVPPGGLGFYPGIVQRGGDAFFNVNQPRFNNVQVGNSAYWVVLHELGHTVGLKHGHGNDRPGPTMDILPYAQNSMEFSVMTYRRYVGAPDVPVGNDTQGDSFAQSLMMLDIAAIQYMYGADFTTNAGNTVYTFSTATGEMFVDGVGQGTPSGNRIFRTVWDGNGTDTYDLSNYTSNLVLDLAPGGWSNFHSGQTAQLSIANNIFAGGNLYNALQYGGDARSLIENAFGGSGNDTINGNQAANFLAGYGGTDALFGEEGNDSLDGGAAYDVLYGGSGDDTLAGGANEDILVGDAGNDIMNGGDGGDVISELFDVAGSGNDTIRGGIGVDIVYAAGGDDTVFGDFSNFAAQNDATNNFASLGDGADGYVGANATDVVVGGAGGDTIVGSAGADALFGEDGNDIVYGDYSDIGGSGGPTAGSGIDLVSGAAGDDLLYGGGGPDLLVGDQGNDVLVGQQGLDVMYGLADNDVINGGPDVDALYGGTGNDRFQVGATGYGIDYIWDFIGGAGASDSLEFQNPSFGGPFASVQAVRNASTFSSGNTTIAVANGSTVILVGVNIANLNDDDITLNGFF